MKMLYPFFLFAVVLLICDMSLAQQIYPLASGKQVSLRGLSVVNDRTVWVSGSAGSVGLSTDGGKTWKWIQAPGYEKTDFRDIEAFSDSEAVIMGITEPAVILRTTNAGNSWTTVYEDSAKSVFLDAMDFSGEFACVVGDPVDGKIFILGSVDKGKSWKKYIPDKLLRFPSTANGEAFFASSGTNIVWVQNKVALASGGKKSSLFLSDSTSHPLLINQGAETTGANSIRVNPADSNEAYVVGGDFSHDTARYRNAVRIQIEPFVQKPPVTAPHGYRSCVEYIDRTRMICCGTSGVDVSLDGGMNWTLISRKSFHVCSRSKSGKLVFLAGTKGSIARLDWDAPVKK